MTEAQKAKAIRAELKKVMPAAHFAKVEVLTDAELVSIIGQMLDMRFFRNQREARA